jgi:hypothetical protein
MRIGSDDPFALLAGATSLAWTWPTALMPLLR